MDEQQTQNENHDASISNDKKAQLEKVKSKALHELVPILDTIQNLDPERKFDICLSAIRMTDNVELAETALNAALSIKETGTKAEALVELINEISYLQDNVS